MTSLFATVFLSLQVACCSTLIIILPAVACGWWLARSRAPWKPVIDGLVHLPLVLPPVVTGYLLLLLCSPRAAFGAWLAEMGISIAFTWAGAVLAAAVMAFPLLVRSVRLAIELVDPELEAAARCMGASRLRAFCNVILPLAWPGLLAGASLAFVRALGEFGATITLAGNIPGETRGIPAAIFTALQGDPSTESQALTLAGIAALLSLLALVAAEFLNARHQRRLGLQHA